MSTPVPRPAPTPDPSPVVHPTRAHPAGLPLIVTGWSIAALGVAFCVAFFVSNGQVGVAFPTDPVNQVVMIVLVAGGTGLAVLGHILRRRRVPAHPAVVTAATASNLADGIGELASLHQRGLITDAEFERKRTELLERF